MSPGEGKVSAWPASLIAALTLLTATFLGLMPFAEDSESASYFIIRILNPADTRSPAMTRFFPKNQYCFLTNPFVRCSTHTSLYQSDFLWVSGIFLDRRVNPCYPLHIEKDRLF
jgi:hypothetical protein